MKTSLIALALLCVAGCSNPDKKELSGPAGRGCLSTPDTLERPPTQGLPCSLIPPGVDLKTE
jgi:hypothetical protein